MDENLEGILGSLGLSFVEEITDLQYEALMLSMEKILKKFASLFFLKDCEIKEEGKKHFLTLYNVRLDQAGGVDFQAANAKSGAHLRVKRKCL